LVIDIYSKSFMKKLIIFFLGSTLVFSSCVVVSVESSNRSMRNYSKCAANDPIGYFIQQGTGKPVQRKTSRK